MKNQKWFWGIIAFIVVCGIALILLFVGQKSQEVSKEPSTTPEATEASPSHLSASPAFPANSASASPAPTSAPESMDPRTAKPAYETKPESGNAVAKQTVVLEHEKHRYHRPSCPAVQSKANSVSKMEAVGKGYQACSICQP